MSIRFLNNTINQIKKKITKLQNTSTNIVTGTSIDLLDSADDYIIKMVLMRNTIQDGTPTSINPIPIKNAGDITELFDNNNSNVINAIPTASMTIDYSANGKSIYVPIIGGMDYIVKKILSARFRVATTTQIPASGVSVIDYTEDNTETSITINASNSAKYLCVYYYLSTQDTLTEQEILESISIKSTIGTINEIIENSDGTEEQTFSFPMQQNQKLLGYTADDGIHQEWRQIVLDGSNDENWNKGNSPVGASVQFYIPKPNNMFIETGSTALTKILCSHFANQEVVNGMRVASYLSFYPSTDLNITTVTEWRAWLSTHNITVQYQLVEEEIESYSQEQQTAYNQIQDLETYKTVTHIYSEDETPANMEVEYVQD